MKMKMRNKNKTRLSPLFLILTQLANVLVLQFKTQS